MRTLDEFGRRIAFIIDKYRKDGAPEREFQIEMENAFEKLGWSRRLGEVIAQYTIPVGSAHSVRPDLIITKEGTPIFVVELKSRHLEQPRETPINCSPTCASSSSMWAC